MECKWEDKTLNLWTYYFNSGERNTFAIVDKPAISFMTKHFFIFAL